MMQRYVPLGRLVVDMYEFGEVSSVRLTFHSTPDDLAGLAHVFTLLDRVYADCSILTILGQVPMHETKDQLPLMENLGDMRPYQQAPQVKRIAGGSMLLELFQAPVKDAAAALALFAAALKNAEKLATVPDRIRRCAAEEEAKRAEAQAKTAAAEADSAEAKAREAEARARRHLAEIAAEMAEEAVRGISQSVAQVRWQTGGAPQVEVDPGAQGVQQQSES
ncbi:hypothetical protein ACWCPX_22370 [Streptomyces olivaceoviridis]